MKAKEFIPASKPRNFVAKNQKTAGAGAHKDMKRAEKQGDVKHKKDLIPMEARDPEDWDEGNTEPGNNFAVYINGKKWKVLPGPVGAYADSPEERRELNRLKDMAQRKSQQTGKKWEVYITGEKANEDVGEGWSDAMVSRRTGQPRTPYSVYIKGKKWKDFENDDHAENVANKLKAKFKADGRDPSVITIAPTDIPEGVAEGESAREKWNRASAEREKKHDAAEKEMKARHARGEEDMKGSIDRLEKHLDKK
jgi:hypothetical protein